MFDEIVISGEVGLRKPEPEIFLLAAERVGLAPVECVFVDDMEPNIIGARELGMTAVHHTSYEQTRQELEKAFGVELT
jgi:HAD superfamily hydrolase (TIGR01509 family)